MTTQSTLSQRIALQLNNMDVHIDHLVGCDAIITRFCDSGEIKANTLSALYVTADVISRAHVELSQIRAELSRIADSIEEKVSMQ